MSPTSTPPPFRPAALTRTALAWLCLTGSAPLAHAVSSDDGARQQPQRWRPSAIFLQLGASTSANAVSIGCTWPGEWRRQIALGTLTGSLEMSIDRWESRTGQGADSWSTRLGVTPVFRLHPSDWGHGWFVESGIGVNVVAPLYRGKNKRFSTVFNFGDHLAVGKRVGDSRAQEITLRVQHFSNGGIRRPNPGENFLQLRYAKDF